MTLDLAVLLARRAFVLWIVVHLAVAMALALGGVSPRDTVNAAMPLLVAAVFAVDLRRRGERLLLANLGVDQPVVLGSALVVAAIAESALIAVLGAVA